MSLVSYIARGRQALLPLERVLSRSLRASKMGSGALCRWNSASLNWRLLAWTMMMVLGCWAAQATLYTTTTTVNAAIPDGDPNGYQSSINLSGMQNVTVNVNVTLNIS